MNDLGQIIVFSTIQNVDAAKNNLDLFLDIVGGGSKEKEFSKEKAKEFLTLMQNHLQSKEGSPKSKFYSLYMIKLIIEQSENKILSVLASHSLLKYMHQIAKETDPNKPITEKGKSLFPDKQLGNDFVRLILQCMKVLSEKSRSSTQEPTRFKKFYGELEDMKIVLPKELKFFDEGMMGYTKKNASVNEVGSVQKSRDSIQQTTKQPQKGDQTKYKQDIEVSMSKINQFIDTLKNQQDPQSLRQQCQLYHKRFQKDSEKYQKIISTIDYSGNDGAQQILALNDFYMHENQLYQKYLANQKDYYSYTPEVLMAAEEMYQIIGKNVEEQQPQPKQEERPFKKVEQSSREQRKNNFAQDLGDTNKELVAKLISHLDEKSKSPNMGFKAIKESLSKQKSFGKTKRSTSGFKKSNATKFGKSMSKSRIAQAFASPPNPYPRDKKYEGQMIETNSQLQKVMSEISKKQGIRRFITCNFKQKNPLFQNTHIQIGVKSQAVYEDVSEFKVLIGIELYIGNKTQELVKNMSINYKGNQDVLLYGNPRTVETVLMGGYQHKHELLVVPLNYHFPMIKMYLKYSVNDETFYENITLPNSILKLASHGALEKKDFIQQWNASTIYRTQQFKWTRNITPDSLSKYIKPLQEFTSYQKFIVKGSENDYELGCQVILKQRYEGVLRIVIRPNFNALLQVGVVQNSQEAIESFIFYAQTLQALLAHVQHEEI